MNLQDLCEGLDVDPKLLERMLNNIQGQYRRFKVPKKSGGVRQISAPSAPLLKLQRKILSTYLNRLPPHPAAKAYVLGRNVRENARFHINQKTLVKLDISNFFDSISQNQVEAIFKQCTSNRNEVAALTKLCTLQGALPQGAATSGCLSNLIFRDCDKRIMRIARKQGLRYTRYADDISISGDVENANLLIQQVSTDLKRLGLTLNEKKTIVAQNARSRQTVTGLVVNEKVSPGRAFLRAIRQDLYYCQKWGLHEHSLRRGFASPHEFMQNLKGRVAWVRQILKADDFENDWINQLRVLSSEAHSLKNGAQ